MNLKGRSTCDLTFTTRAYSSLLGFGNTAPVAYSSSTFIIDVTLVEDRSVPKDMPFMDYVQSNQSFTYSAAASDVREKLPVSQYLMAISILTRDGAAGSSTTATGKIANSNVMGNVKLQINGVNTIQDTTFAALQAQNRSKYGIDAGFASSRSRLDGWALMEILQDGRVETALDSRRSMGVDNVELVFDINGSPISFTNPVTVDIETHELRERS